MNQNESIQDSKKVKTVKLITKGYFAGALTGSFIHIVTAAEKLGGHGVEAYATPFMIDGLAVIGMIMRSDDFSKRTNKIGFRLQCVMGSLSLAMNVYAAHSLFGVLFGIAIVGLFILAEWLSDQIEGRWVDEQAEKDRKAKEQAAADALAAADLVRQAEEAAKAAAAADAWKALCSHPTQCTSETQCASKAKAQRTRKSTIRKAQREAKVLESMIAG